MKTNNHTINHSNKKFFTPHTRHDSMLRRLRTGRASKIILDVRMEVAMTRKNLRRFWREIWVKVHGSVGTQIRRNNMTQSMGRTLLVVDKS